MITRADEIEALRAGVVRLDQLTQENAALAARLRDSEWTRDTAQSALAALIAERDQRAATLQTRILKLEAQVDILRTVILAALVEQ